MARWEYLPFSWIYNFITTIRNKFFDWGILRSHQYQIPVIGIGNLSTGGTGKSPQTIYIVDLLKNDYKIGVISRGYGRKSKGLKVANYDTTFEEIGDEPLQIFERFRNKIVVIVSEVRRKAIEKAIEHFKTDVVILDDSFQHRYVKPGKMILLTSIDHLYTEDHILPLGNLRESKDGAKRADIVVVTKSPPDLSDERKQEIKEQLNLQSYQQLYFSSIDYSNKVVNRKNEIYLPELENYEVVLVTGIANAAPLKKFLEKYVKNLRHLEFKDHHRFTDKDIKNIYTNLQEIKGEKIIITTEKDFMRLKDFAEIEHYLYHLPIDVMMHEKEGFDQNILNYVRRNNTGN